MTAGKRRTAREMAVQMLYQSDLGGSPLPNIFNTFDLAEYLARPPGSAAAKRKGGAARTAAEGSEEAGILSGAGTSGADADSTARGAAEPGRGAGTGEDAGRGAGAGAGADEAAEAAAAPAGAAHRTDQTRQRHRVEDAFQYAQRLVRGTVDHREEIDEMIRGQADNWRLERMPAVDRNILRLAIYEMLYERDTPKLVVVDEAIELAKKFGSEQSGRFVNGLLDGLLKQHTFPGTLT
jgi:transcription antitermination factor NusB